MTTDVPPLSTKAAPAAPKPPPLAPPASMRARHWIIAASFVLFVLVPALVVFAYLQIRAVDQYASRVGFIVRAEDTSSAVDLLGGVTGLGTNSSSDTDILYEFIQSQALVRQIDDQLDLRSLYSRPEKDFVFAFDSAGTIEDLVEYWQRMVKVFYDSGTGLIELRVQAFSAVEAQQIAQAIFKNSTTMINELSADARTDATRYAQDELTRAEQQLRTARQALTRFRSDNQIADPNAELSVQTGLLNALQQQLSDALIEQDLLLDITRQNDPRKALVERKIEVIEQRIAEERKKYGLGGESNFSDILESFERLQTDVEFAQQAHLAARSAYDAALVEAQRQSRYLAAYIEPTLPEKAQYPRRLLITLLSLVGLFLAWGIAVLVFYSIKDRR